MMMESQPKLVCLFITLSLLTLAVECKTNYLQFPECNNITCSYNETSTVLNCTSRSCYALPSAPPGDGWNFWGESNPLYRAGTFDFSSNSITNITVLDNFGWMETLDLSDNLITDIQQDAFMNCPSLRYINLTNNRLTSLRGDLAATRLKRMYLEQNPLNTIQNTSFGPGYVQLDVLSMRSNQISTIEGKSFQYLNALTSLLLDTNQIEIITDRTFVGLNQLQHLSLRENMLTELKPSSFRSCHRLEILDLQSNSIKSISKDAFEGLGALVSLHLQYNKLSRIEQHVFEDLNSLSTLNLAGNPLTYIGAGMFPDSLVSINLERALHFSKLERGTFTKLKQLKNVFISNNEQLQKIHPEAFDQEFSSVEAFSIVNVPLVGLPKNLLNWTKIHTLDAGKNQFYCDCDMLWVLGDDVPPYLKNYLMCSHPRANAGKHPYELSEIQMCASHKRGLRIFLITMVTLIFILTMLGTCVACRKNLMPCWFKSEAAYYKSMTYTPASVNVDSADNLPSKV